MSHGDGVERHGNRRSGSNSERLAEPGSCASAERAERRKPQRWSLPEASSSGKNASAVCVMFAFLGLGLVAIAEIIAQTSGEPVNPAFNFLAGAFSFAAFITGFYAQATQLRRWSRHVNHRLLTGLPVALLTVIMVVINFYAKHKAPSGPRPAPSARQAVADTSSASSALANSSWYGELQQEGLLLIISSFGAKTAEANRFCQRLFKPASYATLSLVNLGAPVPVVLQSLEVGLRMDTGEDVHSFPVKPLLDQKASADTDLLARLTVPRTLAAGAMLSDIPICLAPHFQWTRVKAVTVSFSSRTLTVPGRMMTAHEKQSARQKTTASRPSDGTNITAEAWFKNL